MMERERTILKRWLPYLAGALLLVGVDQWTKHLARTNLKDSEGISLIPGVFRLQYLENRGAAFGLLQNQRLFFILTTVLVVMFLTYAYSKISKVSRFWPIQYCIVVLAAGALGNFVDRLLFQYVTDFLYFELIDFPIFNLADCYVTIGAGIVLLLSAFCYKEEDWDQLEGMFVKQKKDRQI